MNIYPYIKVSASHFLWYYWQSLFHRVIYSEFATNLVFMSFHDDITNWECISPGVLSRVLPIGIYQGYRFREWLHLSVSMIFINSISLIWISATVSVNESAVSLTVSLSSCNAAISSIWHRHGVHRWAWMHLFNKMLSDSSFWLIAPIQFISFCCRSMMMFIELTMSVRS